MDKLRIGIIDTGIEKNVFNDVEINSFSMFVDDLDYINFVESKKDYSGHGTLVISSILSEISCPDNIEIYSISITDSQYSSLELLILSIEKMIEYDVNIINISMSLDATYGSNEEIVIQLEEICNRAREKNIILVCSEYNGRADSLPAAFRSVIGIGKYNNGVISNYECLDLDINSITVNSEPKLLVNREGKLDFFGNSTSYSAAIFTGMLAELILGDYVTFIQKRKLDTSYFFHYIKYLIISKNNQVSVNVLGECSEKKMAEVEASLRYTLGKIVSLDEETMSFMHSDNGINEDNIERVLDCIERKFSILINRKNIRFRDLIDFKSITGLVIRNMHK